jgi:hypothetical protein
MPLRYSFLRMRNSGGGTGIRTAASGVRKNHGAGEAGHVPVHPPSAISLAALLTWGAFVKLPTGFGALLASAATGFLPATAAADEAECLRFFGAEYAEYRRRTRRFVPFLF